jgi:hypothetical protein
MNAERFRKLVDAYGANPRRWPADERAAMEAYRDAHADTREWLRAAGDLDDLLDDHRVVTRDISQRILRSVPRSFAERLVGWLLPHDPALWWRPAMAAALPLAVGILIGVQTPSTTMDWVAQEQALLAVDAGGTWYE